MAGRLTSTQEWELADRLASDYRHHQASVRVLMFQEGLSYGTIHRLLTKVAQIDLRRRGGRNNQMAARDEFGRLDADQRERLAETFAGAFATGARVTTLAHDYGLFPYTVLRLIQQTEVSRPRRLHRAAYGSQRHR